MNKRAAARKVLHLVRDYGGAVRTRQLLEAGVHPREIYALRDEGVLITLGRGVYALADEGLPDQPDMVSVFLRIPHGVLSHLSALAHHGLTEQIPSLIDITIASTIRKPRIDHPPLRVFQCLPELLKVGAMKSSSEGLGFQVYNPARAVVDCFKHRRRIGTDVAIDGLKRCLEARAASPAAIMEMARIRRVAGVIEPVLRGLL